jgi:hypothetical protein
MAIRNVTVIPARKRIGDIEQLQLTGLFGTLLTQMLFLNNTI